jgi:hypothetical protein
MSEIFTAWLSLPRTEEMSTKINTWVIASHVFWFTMFFIVGLTLGVLFLCGMLTWHLGNYPVRRWPLRAVAFFVIEFAVEMGMSSVLIALGRERYGSQLAGWGDWWAMAGQTLWQRGLTIALFALILTVVVQMVRKAVDQRSPATG